jgi:hypothetical protein
MAPQAQQRVTRYWHERARAYLGLAGDTSRARRRPRPRRSRWPETDTARLRAIQAEILERLGHA